MNDATTMFLVIVGAGPAGLAAAVYGASERLNPRSPGMIGVRLNLRGLTGLDALKILRDDPVTAHIPVVALSANAMPHDIRKGLEAGFFGYLTKPINVTEFMDTLNVALEFAELAARFRAGR